jgi:hypothetical protein
MINNEHFGSVKEDAISEQVAMSIGLDFYGLQEHLTLCRSDRNLYFSVKYARERVRSFVFTHVVTTFTGTLVVLGVGYLLV